MTVTATDADTALEVGKWTAAILGLLAVLRVLWHGLTALVDARNMVREQAAMLEQQRLIQQQMTECLAEARSMNKDMARTEQRLTRLEGHVLDRAFGGDD